MRIFRKLQKADDLDVASDHGDPTRVKLKTPVPMMLSARIAVGTELEVLVEHDPTLKELLDRRVDPPNN